MGMLIEMGIGHLSTLATAIVSHPSCRLQFKLEKLGDTMIASMLGEYIISILNMSHLSNKIRFTKRHYATHYTHQPTRYILSKALTDTVVLPSCGITVTLTV